LEVERVLRFRINEETIMRRMYTLIGGALMSALVAAIPAYAQEGSQVQGGPAGPPSGESGLGSPTEKAQPGQPAAVHREGQGNKKLVSRIKGHGSKAAPLAQKQGGLKLAAQEDFDEA